MLDETEFLSDFGIRSLSKYHERHPYETWADGIKLSVEYSPGESTTGLFGGNSNWRGPIWMPLNFLIIESLQRFHYYYTDDFKVECPTGSGRFLTLNEIADEISKRLSRLFCSDQNGRRPVFGPHEKMQRDPRDLTLRGKMRIPISSLIRYCGMPLKAKCPFQDREERLSYRCGPKRMMTTKRRRFQKLPTSFLV